MLQVVFYRMGGRSPGAEDDTFDEEMCPRVVTAEAKLPGYQRHGVYA